MMKPDLHMHTTSSDGLLTPGELVNLAVSRGVTLMAVTDHDTFAGADSLRAKATAIPVLTGTELSLRDMHGLHLLGYGLGDAPELRRTVQELAQKRLTRAGCMLQKLADMGMPIDEAELRANCGGTLGRMHIARAMLEKGYILNLQEAFERYIGNGGPAYVEGERLSMAEALPLMRRSGFVPVLAHPAELELDDMTLRTLLASWQKQGLMGVEVYHPSQKARGFARLDAMVRRMGFLVTGGSDYHCDDGRHGDAGSMLPYWRRAGEDAEALLNAMQEAERSASAKSNQSTQ